MTLLLSRVMPRRDFLRLRGGLSAALLSEPFIVAGILIGSLAARLALLSASFDEVDSGNFVNALVSGYDILQLRPHPPGYPVYVFLGWLVNLIVGDPLLSFKLISAVVSTLALLPFYLLSRSFAGKRLAMAATLLLAFNPQFWLLSVVALSDAPSVLFSTLLAWLSFKGIKSDRCLITSALVLALAIGFRSSNMALAVLPLFALSYRIFRSRDLSVRLGFAWAGTAVAACLLWALPMVLIGAGDLSSYREALDKQWSTTVQIYDVTHVRSPLLLNAVLRVERFFAGYVLVYPWSGDDGRSITSAFLILPWVLGLSGFVVGFRPRSARDLFLLVWALSLIYTVLNIHFLPRYGLPQLPPVIIAAMVGLRFLATDKHSPQRQAVVLAGTVLGGALILLGVYIQPTIATFEFTPPDGGFPGALLALVGLNVLLYIRVVAKSDYSQPVAPNQLGVPRWLITAMLLLVVPVGITGYVYAAEVHNEKSPAHQLVEWVDSRYDASNAAVCWDGQTHSLFEVMMPGTTLDGYWSVDGLAAALQGGKTVFMSELCFRYFEVLEIATFEQVAEFSGSSSMWSKAPVLRLYASTGPAVAELQ